MTDHDAGQQFYEKLKTDPQKIIDWARREIAAYEELIALIEAEIKTE